MRYGKMILAIIVAAIVIGGIWMTVGSSNLTIVTKDVNYEASYEIVYADGSSVMVKKYKTASFQYQNKVVDYIDFDLDAKFKATQEDNVRLLSPRAGGDYETSVTFYVVDSIWGENQISEYPLSAYTNTDYSVLDTGDWYNVFKNLKVTTTEIKDARGDMGANWEFTLKTVVDVWYNLDPEKSDVIHHQLIFSIPFKIVEYTDKTPDPDDGGGGGGGDGKLDPGDPTQNPIQPFPPAKPIIKIDDAIKLSVTPWYGDSGSSSNKNLGKR